MLEFGCGPDKQLKVAKDDDAALSMDWVVEFICFDIEHTHCRHGLVGEVRCCKIGSIDGGEYVKINKAIVLLGVGCKPCVVVWVVEV